MGILGELTNDRLVVGTHAVDHLGLGFGTLHGLTPLQPARQQGGRPQPPCR